MNSQNSDLSSVDRAREFEIGKIFDAIVSVQSLRLQLGTFFGTVNLAALSIAFTTQKAGIVFFAAILIWLFMILDSVGLRALLGFFYSGLHLNQQRSPEDPDNFLGITLSLSRYESQMRNILEMPDREQRVKAITSIPYKSPSPYGFWIPLCASLIEVSVGLTMWLSFGWQLF